MQMGFKGTRNGARSCTQGESRSRAHVTSIGRLRRLRQPTGTSFNSWRLRPMTPGRTADRLLFFFLSFAVIEVGQAYFRLLCGNSLGLPPFPASLSWSTLARHPEPGCLRDVKISVIEIYSYGYWSCSAGFLYLSEGSLRWSSQCLGHVARGLFIWMEGSRDTKCATWAWKSTIYQIDA